MSMNGTNATGVTPLLVLGDAYANEDGRRPPVMA